MEARRRGVRDAIRIYRERWSGVVWYGMRRAQAYLEKPLCTCCYHAAFSVKVEWKDLDLIASVSRSVRSESQGKSRLTSLQTFHEIGPSDTENENAKM